MATRLHYAPLIFRQLLISTARRHRRGGLAASLPASPGDHPFIIVTGAGRSGTSAVARVLHESGVQMGSDFDPPAEFNRVGFYQERGIYMTNEQMLAEMGMAHHLGGSRSWAWRSTVLAVASHYREQMKALARSATWGWKDPIFSLTLEAWLPHLPVRPKLVVCLRSPQAYADSVTHIFGLVDRESTERLWAKHYRRLLDVIRDYQLEATCVEYNALVERPEETVASLAAFVGHELKAEYVDAPLRQFVRPVPAKYERLYEEVLALGGAGMAPVTEGAAPASTSSASAEAVAAYVAHVTEICARIEGSTATWAAETSVPRLNVLEYQRLGLTLAAAVEQTREASAVASAVAKDAQDQLAALEPPAGFERYHEIAEGIANFERLLAEVMLAAAKDDTVDKRMAKEGVRWWRKQGGASAVARMRYQLREEHARANERGA